MSKLEDIVFLDPGHGGYDSGAVAPNGLKESDTVLTVSLKTRAILLLYGVPVVMSRESDVFLSLTERSHAANKAGAKIFVSVHMNSAEDPASGIETFAMIGSDNGNVLASGIQDELLDAFPESIDRGVKFRNFSVLRKTRMPAALAELEFMHTPEGEAHFRDEANLDKCAYALAHAILKNLGIAITDAVKPAKMVAKSESVKTDPQTESLELKLDHLRKVNDSLTTENEKLRKQGSKMAAQLADIRKVANR